MKVSLYTITLNGGYYGGPPVPLLDIFPMARKWGYDGVEIEAKRPPRNPMDLDGAARKAIPKAADDLRLEIYSVAAYNDYSSPVEEHRQNELLMTREQIRLAADVGAPVVRIFAAWSGVTMRDGRITYDIARFDFPDRYRGVTSLERWCYVRDCLAEAARMAADHGVVLALQNHSPVIDTWKDMVDFMDEVDSPALKACLDPPLMKRHDEEYYRAALEAAGERFVHSHFGGRFVRDAGGKVVRETSPVRTGGSDWPRFLKLAGEITGYSGHMGYELCSPVLVGHRHAGQAYAFEQAELAAEFMRDCIATVK